MIDIILLVILSVVNKKNPVPFVLNGFTWQTFICQNICVIIGIGLKNCQIGYV